MDGGDYYPDNHFKQIIMIINQLSLLKQLAQGLHGVQCDPKFSGLFEIIILKQLIFSLWLS